MNLMCVYMCVAWVGMCIIYSFISSKDDDVHKQNHNTLNQNSRGILELRDYLSPDVTKMQ